VATIDEDFRDLLEIPRVGEPAAEQLRHAAAALAARLAAMYGLAVHIEPGDPACVRFTRLESE
jgi:hypothetical protein